MDRVASAPNGRTAITEPKVEYFDVPLLRNEEVVERPAVDGSEHDRIAGNEMPQHRKMRVAMRCDDAVAVLAGKRGTIDVTGAERHRPAAGAGEDDRTSSSHLQPRDSMRIGPRPRPDRSTTASRGTPGHFHEHLGNDRFRMNPDSLAGDEHAGRDQHDGDVLLHASLRATIAAAISARPAIR